MVLKNAKNAETFSKEKERFAVYVLITDYIHFKRIERIECGGRDE